MADTRDVFDGWNRKWRTLWCWSQLYLGYKAAQARGRMMSAEQRHEFWEQKHSLLAERMWSNIAELRGWWVKVGQFLSTRSDLLPVQYVHHLTKLQDMMPTSDYTIIRKIVEEELGKPIAEIFESFEERAIASASIGQVHKAILKGGARVVVKVQHPGVDKTLSQDMMTLTQMSWAFGLLEKGLNFGPILVEWQKAAANELDFRVELGFQQRARAAAIKSGLDVIIPECYPEFTSKKVMVMEFCEGFKITDAEKLAKYKVDTDLLMSKICKSFAYQIHVDGMFNGDPHPGNILVQIDSKTGVAHPVLLDWGLVKMFNDSERIAFAKTVYSVANMDVMGLMAAFEDMGFRFKTDSVIDPELYMDALRIGFFRDTGNDSSMETESASDIAHDSGITKKTVIEKNPIDDWPKDIIFFIRVASLLHGLSLQLNAKIPFLQLLVDKAEQCLLERYIPISPLVYVRYPSAPSGTTRSIVEWKVHRFLCDLLERRQLLLGCQVAVVHEGRMVIDTCVGRMGPINTKPVQRDSLFCIMTVCNGLLATALLKLIDGGELKLDEPVCHSWDGFIRYGKQNITVEDALSHRAGLHRAFPKDLTLSKLTDYEKMVSILENAVPQPPMGKEAGRYAYLTSGWVFSEIIRGATNQRIDDFFKTNFITKFGLGSEIFYPVPYALVKASTAADKERQQHPQQIHPSGADDLLSPCSVGTPSINTTQSLASPSASHQSPISLVSESSMIDPDALEISPSIQLPLVQGSPSNVSQNSEISNFAPSRTELPKKEGGYKFELNLEHILGSQSKTETPDDTRKGERRGNQRLSVIDKKKEIRKLQGEEFKETNLKQTNGLSASLGSQSARDLTFSKEGGKDSFSTTDSGLSANAKPPGPQEISAWLSGAPMRLSTPITGSPIHPLSPVHGDSVALQTSRTPRKSPRGSDILTRFTSSRREIGVARISNKEVMEKLNAAKRAAGKRKVVPTGTVVKYRSKYLHRLVGPELDQDQLSRGSAIELAKSKPHVIDPLIYDSRRLHHLVIPPTNCRSTARALARFYGHLASGKIISRPLLEKASHLRTVDPTLDALILTGGGSRMWGLGYQLYPCAKIPQVALPVQPSSTITSSKRVSFREMSELEGQSNSTIITGLGHGDLGGSVALCFPELKLSICILVNDILNGPIATQEILKFILNCFGLQPAWDVPYSVDQAIDDIRDSIHERIVAHRSSTASIKREKTYHVLKIIPPSI